MWTRNLVRPRIQGKLCLNLAELPTGLALEVLVKNPCKKNVYAEEKS